MSRCVAYIPAFSAASNVVAMVTDASTPVGPVGVVTSSSPCRTMSAAVGAMLVAAGKPPAPLDFAADSTLPVATPQALHAETAMGERA